MLAEKERKAKQIVETEAELKRERSQFALAERAARFGYWRYDLKTKTSRWSPGMFALLGLDSAIHMADGEWLMSQVIPEDRIVVDEALKAAVIYKAPFNYRTHSIDPNSAAPIVDTHGEVELDGNGEVVALLGVCKDVTNEVIAEKEREIAERMYRMMAEESSDIIMLNTPDGKVLFASNALQRVLGRDISQIENRRFMRFVHPDDRNEARKVTVVPPMGKTMTATYRVKHARGHYIWLEVTTRGLYNHAGECEHVISAARDITKRKEQEIAMRVAREHAEAANMAKSSFLANMSHELRTPLNAIIGFADIMRQTMFGPLGNMRYDEYANLIHDSGQLLLDLISDMLDMAKIEAGKLELCYERVDLSGTIGDCVRLLKNRADEGGVDITVTKPRAEPLLIADRRAVKQVLLNLFTNAVKFTMAGGHVHVTVTNIDSRVRIAVRDDGIGIPAADLPRLGRPFEQVCADPMLAKGGTGLGLALVRALVEKHGGTLKIESEEGIGTEVTVELPLQPAQRTAAAA
ncbi:MAG TPA: ATP-binding protein [Rhizomicrobium sp.]|jgi:PAS domain S-box-containing protein|nr:ATP-binding protein [Rhizomicrobium sp.]